MTEISAVRAYIPGIYAPTPVLVRQLAGGAPADILLTADPMWMYEAVRRMLVQPETRVDLLANDLVLAGPAGGSDGGLITRSFALGTVVDGGRLAMFDPDHDPAGRFARQSLQALGFWQAIERHIAIAESSQAAVVLVDHGEAPAAICFKTDLHGDEHATVLGTFPADSHAPIIYPAALAREVRNSSASEALAFLHSPRAQNIFTGFDYTLAG